MSFEDVKKGDLYPPKEQQNKNTVPEGLDLKSDGAESRETIEISDMRFGEVLEETSGVNVPSELAKNSVIISSSTKSFASPEFQPVSNFLYVLLPKYLNFYFKVKYATNLDSKWYKTIILKTYIPKILAFIESKKIKSKKYSLILKDLVKFPVEPEQLDNLHDFMLLMKRNNIHKKLEKNDLKLFRWFYKVYTSDDLNKKALAKIFNTVTYISDSKLKTLLRSVDFENADPTKRFIETENKASKITKKYFKKANPSIDEINKLRDKNYEGYKEWRKALTASRKASKSLLENSWNDKGWKLVEVSKARQLLKQLNLQDPIDNNFVGMVGLAPTPSIFFTYHTLKGKQLVSTPGTNVIMNKNYDPDKDNTYYCTSIPIGSITNKKSRHYTIEFTKKSSGKLYTSSKQVVEKIDDIRQQVISDMKSNKSTGTKKISATIVRLADLTCARIGNEASERIRNRFGLHNLKVSHFKFKGSKCVISYIGKTGKKQKHEVTDPNTIKVLKDFASGKKPSDYMFSKKNDKKPITPNTVNNYLKAIGFPGTHHIFRKYHANRLFSELIKKAKVKKGNKKAVISEYKKVVGQIADLLGNTITVAASSYIDPVLQITYFKNAQVEIPTTLQKAIKKSYLADPDVED